MKPGEEDGMQNFLVFFPRVLTRRDSDSYELESVNIALAGDTGERLWMDEHIVVILRFEIVW